MLSEPQAFAHVWNHIEGHALPLLARTYEMDLSSLRVAEAFVRKCVAHPRRAHATMCEYDRSLPGSQCCSRPVRLVAAAVGLSRAAAACIFKCDRGSECLAETINNSDFMLLGAAVKSSGPPRIACACTL